MSISHEAALRTVFAALAGLDFPVYDQPPPSVRPPWAQVQMTLQNGLDPRYGRADLRITLYPAHSGSLTLAAQMQTIQARLSGGIITEDMALQCVETEREILNLEGTAPHGILTAHLRLRAGA